MAKSSMKGIVIDRIKWLISASKVLTVHYLFGCYTEKNFVHIISKRWLLIYRSMIPYFDEKFN